MPNLYSFKWQKNMNFLNSQSKENAQLQHSHPQVNTQSFFSNYIQLLSSRQKRRVKLLTGQTEAADVLSLSAPTHLSQKVKQW